MLFFIAIFNFFALGVSAQQTVYMQNGTSAIGDLNTVVGGYPLINYYPWGAKLAVEGNAKVAGNFYITPPNIGINQWKSLEIAVEENAPLADWMTVKQKVITYFGEFQWLTNANPLYGVNPKLMKLTSTGDGANLFLNGELKAKLVRVSSINPWADYVFDKNYHLLPLAEVERFIEKNKHLPEIPSAKEIEKNGQDLGSLQVLQMQKIEELTLYLIAQEKRMQALEQKLLEMQKKK